MDTDDYRKFINSAEQAPIPADPQKRESAAVTLRVVAGQIRQSLWQAWARGEALEIAARCDALADRMEAAK